MWRSHGGQVIYGRDLDGSAGIKVADVLEFTQGYAGKSAIVKTITEASESIQMVPHSAGQVRPDTLHIYRSNPASIALVSCQHLPISRSYLARITLLPSLTSRPASRPYLGPHLGPHLAVDGRRALPWLRRVPSRQEAHASGKQGPLPPAPPRPPVHLALVTLIICSCLTNQNHDTWVGQSDAAGSGSQLIAGHMTAMQTTRRNTYYAVVIHARAVTCKHTASPQGCHHMLCSSGSSQPYAQAIISTCNHTTT